MAMAMTLKTMTMKPPSKLNASHLDALVAVEVMDAVHAQFLPPAEVIVTKAGLPAPLGSVNSGEKATARAVGATNRAKLKPAS